MNHTLSVTSFDVVLKELADGAVITLDAHGKLQLNGRPLHSTTWSTLLSAGLITRLDRELPISTRGNGYVVTNAGRNAVAHIHVVQ